MFIEGLQLLVGVLTLLLPGFLVLLALGIRERLWWAGLSAPLTMGLILVTALLTGITGIRFSIYSFVVVLVLVLALGIGVQWLFRRRRAPGEPAESLPDADAAKPGILTGRPLRVAQLVGLVIGLYGVGRGVLTWKRGLGSWSTPTQEHDPVTHSILTAFIHFTGKAAPWQVLPNDVVHDTSIQFYPPGFSSISALLTDLVGNTMTSMNLVTVAAAAVALPLSVAALTVAVLRHSGLGRGWLELAAGVAALISTVLYHPTIAFAHDGGVLPNAVALTMVPGIVAVMLVLRKRQWAGALAIGVAAAGLVSVHPSAVASVGVTLVGAWIGLLFTRSGRGQFKQSILPLVVTGAAAAVLVVPMVSSLLGLGGVGDSPADIRGTSLGSALRDIVRLPDLGYFDPTGGLGQLKLGILALVAALAVIVFRRGWPILTAWLGWVLISISFHLSPSSGPGAFVGRFFYRVASRIDAHMYILIPVLIGVLAATVASALSSVRLPKLAPRLKPFVAVGAVGVLVLALVLAVFPGYNFENVRALQQRYAQPQFVRYNASDSAAVDWLHEHVKPGETILNSANDGSTLAYVEYDLPILNIVPDGHSPLTDHVDLLRSFDTYPDNKQIQTILRNLNVTWVYEDSQAPTIGTDKLHWNGGGPYELAPGLQHLAGLPGLQQVFSAGTVTVYRLNLDQLRPND